MFIGRLEYAHILHDIACPLCRRKYGDTDGRHQEAEIQGLLLPFLAEFDLPEETVRRVVFLLTHHHACTDVDGPDCQILLEADFLVNAEESGYRRAAIQQFRDRVFQTASGKRLLSMLSP